MISRIALMKIILHIFIDSNNWRADWFRSIKKIINKRDYKLLSKIMFFENLQEDCFMANYKEPYYLVKVVDKKWAEKLMDGEVFMRAIACFADLSNRSKDSNNQFRGDSLEGFCLSFKDHHNPYVYIEDLDGNISEFAPNQVGLIDVLKYREKIFCLYALEYNEENNQFVKPDQRILDFGDTAVIIHNPHEFLYRICNTMLQRFGDGFWTSFMRVDYNVEFLNGQPYDEFCKSSAYLWQKEFRIALDLAQGKFDPNTLDNVTDFARATFPGEIVEDTNPDSLADSITLNIGDIRHLCVSMPTSEFVECNNILMHIPKTSFPPKPIMPFEMPRPARPTFFKVVMQLP